MYLETKSVTALDTKQVAWPVGQNQDSYTIVTWFKENLETGVITSKHEVVKNWSSQPKDPNTTYKEGARFRETLFTGSYLQCQSFIADIVKEQGEWRQIPGKPFEKELRFDV